MFLRPSTEDDAKEMSTWMRNSSIRCTFQSHMLACPLLSVKVFFQKKKKCRSSVVHMEILLDIFTIIIRWYELSAFPRTSNGCKSLRERALVHFWCKVGTQPI
ncbi:hypothetical protein POVWA2_028770 [Plasmodium ovale wallikeri]|uniref:Uncharacterized protein n=1 Tax=Plasmodium ovale wallikeri TaxID=864142 RepID=A0A1A8YW28_PLAOA|nr:hypothetical protein POVWA1_028930 [Plasmodium ovale wallikeri]SBT36155.1 hypothetical protein POVWA2_028770 [Plasmodium ovale wallikeri]